MRLRHRPPPAHDQGLRVHGHSRERGTDKDDPEGDHSQPLLQQTAGEGRGEEPGAIGRKTQIETTGAGDLARIEEMHTKIGVLSREIVVTHLQGANVQYLPTIKRVSSAGKQKNARKIR